MEVCDNLSFGNSQLFPFPAVQYIPLTITNVLTGKISKPLKKTSIPPLIPGSAISIWRPKLLSELNLMLPENLPEEEFPLLALNLSVKDAKYRSFFVTMLGTIEPDTFQLFTIPKNRFYKQQLYFELFDADTGKSLAYYSLFKPTKK